MERRACRPHGFGERFQRQCRRRGEKNEDKRPNKVYLNIEAARPFFPCPYKELLVNPDGLSSSLYQELIPPSRIGNITAGAWKHALTHTNKQGYVVLRERERERGQGAYFFLYTRGQIMFGGTY